MTQKSLRKLKSLCAKRGITVTPDSIAGRSASIRTLYNGGANVSHFLDGKEISLLQLGSDGDWLAVIPLEILLALLESESLQKS